MSYTVQLKEKKNPAKGILICRERGGKRKSTCSVINPSQQDSSPAASWFQLAFPHLIVFEGYSLPLSCSKNSGNFQELNCLYALVNRNNWCRERRKIEMC